MVNPDLLVDAVRDKLKKVSAVVAMVGAARITSYEDSEASLSIAVNDMKTPSILVAWMGNDPAGAEDQTPWRPRIGIFLRLGANQRLGDACTKILDSVATGDTQKFTETEFHDDFEQIGVPELRPRDQDDDGAEFPQIHMVFRQRTA